MAVKTKAILVVGGCSLVVVVALLPFIVKIKTTASASTSCLSNLRMIDAAKETWAKDHHKSDEHVPTWNDLAGGPDRYLKDKPACPNGGSYTIGRVSELPSCSIPADTEYFRKHDP